MKRFFKYGFTAFLLIPIVVISIAYIVVITREIKPASEAAISPSQKINEQPSYNLNYDKTFADVSEIDPQTILPKNYIEVITKLNIGNTKAQKVQLLNEGKIFIKTKQSSAELYKYLSDNGLPIFITDDMVLNYFVLQSSGDTNMLDHKDKIVDLISRVSNVRNVQALTQVWVNGIEKGSSVSLDSLKSDVYISSNKNLYGLLLLITKQKENTQPLQDIFQGLIDWPSLSEEKKHLIAWEIINKSDIQLQEKFTKYIEVKSINSSVLSIGYAYGENNTYGNLDSYKLNNSNFNEKYDFTVKAQPKGSVRIPVLMYHQFGAIPTTGSKFLKGLYVTPEIFEQQVAYLVAHNYKTLTTKEFYDLLVTGKNPKQKSVLLTFDDSKTSQYKYAYPILKKYGVTGTFFVISQGSAISANQLKEMSKNGMTIDSHSSHHKNLETEDDPNNLSSEITSSKYSLQALTGKPVYSIAYPGCVADSEAFKVVANSGYLLGFSCGRGIDHYFSRRLSLQRIHIFNDMNSFKKALSWGL